MGLVVVHRAYCVIAFRLPEVSDLLYGDCNSYMQLRRSSKCIHRLCISGEYDQLSCRALSFHSIGMFDCHA